MIIKSCILMLQIFDGGGEKYLLTKDNGFLDELSVTNGKLYASQASIPPTLTYISAASRQISSIGQITSRSIGLRAKE
jgi:hypothetical protein